MSLARPLRIVCAALAVGAYVAAATTPCPSEAAGPARSRAPVSATHAAHHGHGDATATAEAAHAGSEAVLAAPCACGCGKRAGTVSMARLGPVLAYKVVDFAAPSAPDFGIALPRRATSIALAPPDPVPISRFA